MTGRKARAFGPPPPLALIAAPRPWCLAELGRDHTSAARRSGRERKHPFTRTGLRPGPAHPQNGIAPSSRESSTPLRYRTYDRGDEACWRNSAALLPFAWRSFPIADIALYSGWGPEARRRNPGDELCRLGAVQLLAAQGLTRLIDVRTSMQPIRNPWTGDVIIGGGTVLPAVFEPWVGPGLKWARRKYVFGSGCLSPDELARRGIVAFDRNAYRDVHVIGVRGPDSTAYFRQYFGRTVDFIGDLAFAFAQDRPSPPASPNAVFFVIESASPARRLGSTLHDVMSLCGSLTGGGMLGSFRSTLCTTGDGFELLHRTDLGRLFDDHVDLDSSQSLVSAIASSAFVVTERLHPAIIALSFGKPFIYIQSTSKAFDLQRLLCAVSPHHLPEFLFLDVTHGNVPLPQRYMSGIISEDLPYELVAVSRRIRERLRHAAEQLAGMLTEHQDDSDA